jgi:hypothetical protein
MRHTFKTKDRVTRTPLKIRGELRITMGKLKSIILFCRKVSFLTSPNDNLFQDQKFDDNHLLFLTQWQQLYK